MNMSETSQKFKGAKDRVINHYQTTKQNISLHLKNIFRARELNEEAVVKEYLTTASDKNGNSIGLRAL